MVSSSLFTVQTTARIQVVNITPQVEGIVTASGVRQGTATIMCRHTTAGIAVNENEPQLLRDVTSYLTEFVKENPQVPFLHDCMHLRPECPATEPHNADAHIKQLFIGSSQTVPVKDGKLDFGRWQQVLLIEQDGPRTREVTVTTQGETVQDGLAKYWADKAALINEQISLTADDDWEESLLGVADYMLQGGKRIRGVLTLLVCECLGGDMGRAIDAAVAVERIHASTLALDDCQDGDKTRRGRSAAWQAWRLNKVVQASVMFFPHALKMLRKYGREAVYVAIDALWEIAKGQAKDRTLASYRDAAVYSEIIEGKTAALFSLATTLGALAAGASGNTKKLARDYGRRLGYFFQVADELQDREAGTSVPICFEEWEHENPNAVKGLLSEVKRLASEFPDNEYRRYLEELPQMALEAMIAEVKTA